MPKKEPDVPGLKTLDIDDINTSHDTLKTKYEELLTTHTALNETVTKLSNDMISKSEFKERMERISEDLSKQSEDMEVMRNASSVKAERFVYNDYRSLLEGQDWLVHEDRTPFSPLECRGYALFQLPVAYDKMEYGQELKNLRDLHDAFIFTDVFNRHKHGPSGRYKVEQSIMFKRLTKGVEKFDAKLAHAMAGGNTGFGAEWVPTETSSAFNEIARIQPNLANRFETWIMPVGASAYYPFQEGKAVVYKGSEALVDNPVQARKTNIATERKLFSPKVFIGALKASEELTEDSIIEMVGFIRRELAVAILEGLDSAIINGDTTSPHMDNAAATQWETYEVETAFKGLRRIAVDDSTTFDAEAYETGSGVGAMEISVILKAKSLMGVLGVKSSECLYVTGVKGKTEVQTMWANEDFTGNTLGVMVSGDLPTADGSEFHISGEYLEDLESDGFGNAAAGTDKHTSLCAVHLPSFRIGQRRGVTIEMDKDILTQQQAFVATARYDFGKVASSTLTPVSCAINIQHTA